MNKRSILFLVALSCSLLLSAAEEPKQPAHKEIGNLVMEGIPDIPPEVAARMAQYQNTRSASFQDWVPSGSGMLIATRFGDTPQLHHVSTPGSDRRQITFFKEPVQFGLYSPAKDRNGVLFGMDQGGGEFYQFHWLDLATGKFSVVTDGGKSRNQSPVWTGDGKKLAFVSTKRNGTDYDLYIMDGADPKTTRLVKEMQGAWFVLDWVRDDAPILIQHTISINEAYLFTLNSATGEMKEINPTNGAKKIFYGSAVLSRDRHGVYYTSDEDSEFQRLTYFDLNSGQKEVLTPRVKRDVASVAASKDGKWLAFTINDDGVFKLYVAQASEPEKTQIVDLPKAVINGLSFDPQSKRLAFNVNGAQTTSDVYTYDLETQKVDRWTFSEVGGLNPDNFVTPELINYPTFDSVSGGKIDPKAGIASQARQIPAFYYKPKDDTNKPFPVIINIHGGPESQAQASFSAVIQYWVNELGAAVLVPNVRGSDGYGKTYLLQDNGFKREDSVKDIGALLDWIKTRPELDAKRVAVFGGSYGGFMVLSSMFHYNDRLKCGVDAVGISNFVTFLQHTEDYRRDLRRAEYGDERDPKMHDFLDSISPTTNVKKITIPLFVVQGMNDPRVPATEAEQIVKAVRGNGGEVWYLLAKDEGHGFQKKANRDFYLNAVSLFFEQHLLK
jgi:dipeptidyl aminopeptidase/acylaminoacyl peptidase